MVKFPFWRSHKLAGKGMNALPGYLRTLLKTSKIVHQGYGPRTLDSVISFLPTIKEKRNNEFVRQKLAKMREEGKITSNISTINVIVCVSQRDFPISIHQRLLVLLTMKGVDLNKVHWVITASEQLGSYPLFPKVHEQLDESNIENWKYQFHAELKTYLSYFIFSKLKKNENIDDTPEIADFFDSKYEDLKESFQNKLEKYNVSINNVHLFSSKLPWTINSIVNSLDYDPFHSTQTYVIGQPNSGKSTLVRNMLIKFKEDLNETEVTETENISDPNRVEIAPNPFSSKFRVYNVPGMKIIDTPAYVRTEGGIYSHVNKYGCHLLRIQDEVSRPKTLQITPRILHKHKPKSDKQTSINIGGIIFIKPWLVLPRTDDARVIKDADSIGVEVNLLRNLPGRAESISGAEVNSLMWDVTKSKVLTERQWSTYVLTGERIELVLDNIGSFTAAIGKLPVPLTKVYWEIYLPKRVRLLSRDCDDEGNVIISSVPSISVKLPVLLGDIERKQYKQKANSI